MKCILAVKVGDQDKVGLRGFTAAHVQKIWQAMDKENESLAYLRQNILHNE